MGHFGVFDLIKIQTYANTDFLDEFLRDVWLERAVEKNEKLESFKLDSLKLENFCLSWKASTEVGKN